MSAPGPPSGPSQVPIDPARAAESNTARIVSIVTVFHVIALTTIALRIYARVWVIRNPGADDWVMLLCAVSSFAQTWSPQLNLLSDSRVEGLRYGRLEHLHHTGTLRTRKTPGYNRNARLQDFPACWFLAIHHLGRRGADVAQDIHCPEPITTQSEQVVYLVSVGHDRWVLVNSNPRFR